MQPKVMIGCPVRNRAWILPRYLESLERIEYPRSNIEYCFVINDCIDRTPCILEEFAARHGHQVKLIYHDMKSNRSHIRGQYNFHDLAGLRNILLAAFIASDCQYLFSLDSDILVPPHALVQLIAADCDIIAALVCNGHELGDDKIYNLLTYTESGSLIHLKDFPRDQVFRVDCTGAAYLIKRHVIETLKVRYSAKFGAEDIGFCQAARKQGLAIHCDGRIECTHIMSPQ